MDRCTQKGQILLEMLVVFMILITLVMVLTVSLNQSQKRLEKNDFTRKGKNENRRYHEKK